MPIFRVERNEHIDVTVEEIWRAYRTDVRTEVYEVEADTETDAIAMVEDGQGTPVDDYYETGDTYDSDYHDTGDEIYSEVIEADYQAYEAPTFTLRLTGRTQSTSQMGRIQPKPKWRV